MAKKGLVFISKTSFSGSSAVNIDNCFSATYVHYLVRANFSASAALNGVHVGLRAAGTTTTAANYRRQQLGASSTTISGARATGETAWQNALGYTEATSIGYRELWISNPFDAARTTSWGDMSYDVTSSIAMYPTVFAHDLATSYDGFSATPAGGATITGSISVFGLVTA